MVWSRHLKALKRDWHEAERTQAELQGTLTETLQALCATRGQLEEVQASHHQEVQCLGDELSQAWADRDAAASE